MKAKAFLILFPLIMTLVGPTAAEEAISLEQPTAFWYAAMAFSGGYDQMAGNIQTFVQEFFKQGLAPRGALLGVYYNDLRQVKQEDLKWAIAFPIAAEAAVTPPLVKEEFKACRAVTCLHVGPYADLGKSYDRVFAYLEAKGLQVRWPVFDHYLDNPMQVKPEALRTRIVVPVID